MAEYRPLRLSDLEQETTAPEFGPKRLRVEEPRPADFPMESPEERRQRAALQLEAAEQNEPPLDDPEREAERQRDHARLRKAAGDVARPVSAVQNPVKTGLEIPTWADIEALPRYQALDDKSKESVRDSYWLEVVKPRVPTAELEEAWRVFEERSRPPGILQKAKKAVTRALTQPPVTEGEFAGGEFDTPRPQKRYTGDEELDRFYNDTELADRVFNPLVAGGRQVRQSVAAQAAQMAASSLRELDAMRSGQADGAIPRRIRSLSDEEFQTARKARIDALDREVGRVIKYQESLEKMTQNPAMRGVAQAETLGKALDQFWRDPLGVSMAVGLQSIAYSAPGLAMGTAGAIAGGPIGGAALMGLGSFGAEYLASVNEALASRGITPDDYLAAGVEGSPQPQPSERLKNLLNDPRLLAEIRADAATRGGIIGAFDALTFGVAARTLAPKAIAGRALSPAARQLVNIPTQTAVQAVGGAAGEAGAQLATEGAVTRPGEVLLEAVGEGATAPVEVAGLLAARGRQPPRTIDLSDPAAISREVAGEPPAQAAPEPGAEALDAGAVLGREEPEAALQEPSGEPTGIAVGPDIEGRIEPTLIESATPAESQPSAAVPMAPEAPAAQAPGAAAPAVAAPETAEPAEAVKLKEEAGPAATEQPAAPADAIGASPPPRVSRRPEAADQPAEQPEEGWISRETTTPKGEPTGVTLHRKGDMLIREVQDQAGTLFFAFRALPGHRGYQELGGGKPIRSLAEAKALFKGTQTPPKPSPVDEAAHEAASSPLNEKPQPTTPQIQANNAPLGHPRVAGMEISTESPAGSIRRDVKNVPPRWQVKMKGAHYGYIRDTIGYDKDHLDVFVKEGTPENWSGDVFVINQNKDTGRFDEHKAMAGFDTIEEARETYLRNYDDREQAAKRIRSIVPMEVRDFKRWAYSKEKEYGPLAGELNRDKHRQDLAKYIEAEAAEGRGNAELLFDFDIPAFERILEARGWERYRKGKGEFFGKRDVDQGTYLFVRSQGQLSAPIVQWGEMDSEDIEAFNKRGEGDAGPVRGDKGQADTRGQKPEGRKADRRGDVQQAPSRPADEPGAPRGRPEEAQAQRPAAAQPSAEVDRYAHLKGKEIKVEVEVEETGETAEVSVDASTALQDLDERIATARQLLECLS